FSRFCSDGKTLVTVDENPNDSATLRLWDVATGRERAMFITDLRRVEEAEFSPDGSLLAARDTHCVIELWDTVAAKQRAVVREVDLTHDRTMRFSADSTLLAVQMDFRAVQL